MEAKLLELRNLTKGYPAPGGGGPVEILSGVDLSIEAGESAAVVGPSGSGKSTLLNIIGGLDLPSGGEVVVGGRPLSGFSEAEMAAHRNRTVGFVFQLHHLLPQCSILENVLVPTLAGLPPPARAEGEPEGLTARERAEALLERVGLGDRLRHRPGELSGGERQRVAVARALINGPKLLLADEPTGSLDRASAGVLADLLAEINREEGVTLIIVTHSADLAARAGRVLELQDGVLVPAER